MSFDESVAFGRGVVSDLGGLAERDDVWIVTALATGVSIYIAYLATHPYPAYAGGLYLVMAEQISSNGYALPTRIPYYTETGIPFGYPPLLFYVTAVAHDLTGVPLLAFTEYVPGAVVIAYLIPYYGIAKELLGSPRRAGVATVLFAATPTVLRWHVSAGGLVRAPAMFLALSGVFVGLKLFRTGDRRWLVPGTVLFGLTVLTHPTYTVFFGLSYLLIYAFFDRTRTGLASGMAVALGGVVLSSPWWLQVVARHGVDIFFTASGTHSGLAGGPERLVKFTYALNDMDVESLFYYGAYAGVAYSLVRRRYFLPAWLAASSYFIGKNRFLFVAGSMLLSSFVFDFVLPKLRRRTSTPGRRRAATVGTVLVVVIAAATVGTLFSASALDLAHDHSPSQPQYMDDADRRGMAWMRRHTDPDDGFVVLGDAAEWVPLFADRTILLGPWGWEWKESSGYYREMELYDSVTTCRSAQCLTASLERAHRTPEYVYLFKGTYTVRGKEYRQRPGMVRSMRRSGRYELAFENSGVMIFEVRNGVANPVSLGRRDFVPVGSTLRPNLGPS